MTHGEQTTEHLSTGGTPLNKSRQALSAPLFEPLSKTNIPQRTAYLSMKKYYTLDHKMQKYVLNKSSDCKSREGA